VLIEGDKDRFKGLMQNMEPWRAICVNKFVGIDGADSLDSILADTPIKENFDLLSIDIDGNDYHVWKSLQNYRPKVVIIEIGLYYKPGIKKINEIVSNYVFGESGSSISSMTDLAEEKGYKLICCIGCNAVYVKAELYGIFHPRPILPREVFCYDQLLFNRLTVSEKLRKLKLILMRPKSEIYKSILLRLSPKRE
jgi:hypothetical protein